MLVVLAVLAVLAMMVVAVALDIVLKAELTTVPTALASSQQL